MLGSLSEAEDAVQETWLRLSGTDVREVENLGGWLTTVISRVCLNMLRSRKRRREDSFGLHLPDPIVTLDPNPEPEDEVVRAESVNLALLVVLDTLSPPERVAFVLHDMFDVPFEEIATLVDRAPAATRQLASRARRRVKMAEIPPPDPNPARHREVVDAFFSAARGGDVDRLVAMLDPDVVLRADYGERRLPASGVTRGATAVAGQARAIPGAVIRPVLVNGTAGVLITLGDRAIALMAFTVRNGKIVEIDAIADPERVSEVAASVLETL